MLSVIERRNSGTVVEERTSTATVSVTVAPAGTEAGEAKVRSIELPDVSELVSDPVLKMAPPSPPGP